MRLTSIQFLGLAALVAAAGCNAFSPSRSAELAYEQTREQIRTGEYRQVSYDETPEAEYEQLSDSGIDLNDLSPTTLNEQFRNLTGRGTNPDVAKELYAQGQELYRQAAAAPQDQRGAKFEEAADQLKSAAERWPDSALQQDALYWSGQAYFFADKYPKANQQFEQLLNLYPNSKYLDPVEARRFSIAMYWLALDEQTPETMAAFNLTDKQRPWRDTYGHAVRILNRIRLDDPRGKLADDATLAAGNAYFRTGDYNRADEYYTDLRRAFPSSEHQFTAHLLGMQSKLQSYMGHDYSGAPLEEAAKLIEQIRKQFPNEAAENRELLARSYAKIRLLNAERKWARAKYHDWRQEYRAARIFYEQVAMEFSDTPYAAKAQTRITEIAGLPPKPETRFGWLINAFPGTEDEQPVLSESPLSAFRR